MARLLLALAGLLVVGACQPGSESDAAFGQRVRAYLLSHPEVLQEVSQRLEAKQDAADAAALKRAEAQIPELRARIEQDSRDYTANPHGRVTVTEFFDYRCPHCRNLAPAILALIRDHPDVRFVFKETPIFGAVSEHAARAALAVRRAGGDSLGLYQALMTTAPLDDETIDRLARASGAKAEDLAPAALGRANAQLAQTAELFNRLDLEGTPAFIVGDQIILGEDFGAVNAAIEKRRRGA